MFILGLKFRPSCQSSAETHTVNKNRPGEYKVCNNPGYLHYSMTTRILDVLENENVTASVLYRICQTDNITGRLSDLLPYTFLVISRTFPKIIVFQDAQGSDVPTPTHSRTPCCHTPKVPSYYCIPVYHIPGQPCQPALQPSCPEASLGSRHLHHHMGVYGVYQQVHARGRSYVIQC